MYEVNKHNIFETVIIFFTTELSYKSQLKVFIELEIPNNESFYSVNDIYFDKILFVNIMSSWYGNDHF